jgi:hypothetical protein
MYCIATSHGTYWTIFMFCLSVLKNLDLKTAMSFLLKIKWNILSQVKWFLNLISEWGLIWLQQQITEVLPAQAWQKSCHSIRKCPGKATTTKLKVLLRWQGKRRSREFISWKANFWDNKYDPKLLAASKQTNASPVCTHVRKGLQWLSTETRSYTKGTGQMRWNGEGRLKGTILFFNV